MGMQALQLGCWPRLRVQTAWAIWKTSWTLLMEPWLLGVILGLSCLWRRWDAFLPQCMLPACQRRHELCHSVPVPCSILRCG